MRWLLAIAVLAGCWRGATSASEAPPSFIARTNALTELQRSARRVGPKLAVVVQRIVGLASEAERAAIRDDLADIEREVAELSHYAEDARARGDDPAILDAVDNDLQRAALAIVQLRQDLLYAKTTAELEALDGLPRDTNDDPQSETRRAFVVRKQLEPVLTPDPAAADESARATPGRRVNGVIIFVP